MSDETTEANTDQAAQETVQEAPERLPDLEGLDVTKSDEGLLKALMALPDGPEEDPNAESLTVEAHEEESTSEESGETDETTQSDDADSAVARDLDKARTALKRDGWDDATLEASGEEFILAQGKRVREAEADRERQRQRIQELEAEKEGVHVQEPAAGAGKPEDSGSLLLNVDELTSPLADELGEEVAKPFRTLADTVAQLQQSLAGMQETRITEHVEAARQQLGERFPGLLDDEVYASKVKPEMEMLADTARYQGKGLSAIEGLMERAAKLADLSQHDPEAEAEASRARSQATRQKRAGSSSGPGRKGGSSLTKATDEQLEIDALVAMEAHDDQRYQAICDEVANRRSMEAPQF